MQDDTHNNAQVCTQIRILQQQYTKLLHTLYNTLHAKCNSLEDELRTNNAHHNNQIETMQRELDRLRMQPPQNIQLNKWHKKANDKIGTMSSRTMTDCKFYSCAHAHNDGACTWHNKKVTLQAYILHLQRRHRQNISSNPDMNPLPVLAV